MVIPIVILGAIFLISVDRLYRDQVYSDAEGNIELLVQNLNNEAKNLSDIVLQVRIQKVINNDYRFEDNPLLANNIKQILSSFVITSNFYDEIIFYSPNSDYLFSSNTTYEKGIFFNYLYQINGMTGSETIKLLGGMRGPTTLQLYNTDKKNSRIAYCQPIRDYKDNLTGMMIFLLSESKFNDYIKQHIAIYDTKLVISGEDGQVFYGQLDEQATDGIDYFYTIPELGWNLEFTVADDVSLFSAMSNYLIIFILSLLLIITISSLAIMHFMHKNYTPLDRISRKVKEMDADSNPEPNEETEYERIDRCITQLNSNNNSLIAQVTILKNSRRNIELQKLLTGGYYDSTEEFNEANKDIITLRYRYFIFTCILFTKDCPDIEEFADKSKNELKGISDTYYIFTPFPKRLYLLSNVESLENIQTLYKELKQLKQFWEDEYSNAITMGISSVKEGITEIPALFLEARTAIDYRFIKGKGTIIRFDEVSSANLDEYPKCEIENLKKAILQKNNAQIEQYLNDFIAYLESNKIDLFTAKGLCFDILRSYMMVNPDKDIKGMLQNEMIMMNDVETASELIDIIKASLKSYDEESRDMTKEDRILVARIQNYIQVNCFDCNFSLQDVAEYVSMNISRLSSFYKNATGNYLVDYVSNVRLEKAQKLLDTTDLPIKEISIAVGYYNSSSFIRRFRQKIGISPGDYRKIIH